MHEYDKETLTKVKAKIPIKIIAGIWIIAGILSIGVFILSIITGFLGFSS